MLVQQSANLAVILLAAMVISKSGPGLAQRSGPLFCYQCDRNCDVELGTIKQCPGNLDQCATFYSDEAFKRIQGRGCLYHNKGCSKLFADHGYVCTCPEHFCNNRRLMPAFFVDPEDDTNSGDPLLGVEMADRIIEENKRLAMYPEGELLFR